MDEDIPEEDDEEEPQEWENQNDNDECEPNLEDTKQVWI